MPERVKVIAEAHHDGRKTKGVAEVEVNPGYKAEPDYGVLLVVRSEQGYAPGARGYSSGGVSKFSPAGRGIIPDAGHARKDAASDRL